MLQGTTLHTVGLDLGKRFMQVHGADATGEKLLNRRLRRDQVAPFFEALPPCCVAIETCGGGHHWGRVLGAMGHTVKLIPAQFVKPYLKSNKNDAADAAAIDGQFGVSQAIGNLILHSGPLFEGRGQDDTAP